ncbi:hypothetical protein UFOVP345_44 [uncultured Caudovirales phage]|uniref:Uncharacterized protein n=1 Tax=uncultured Caudovirales phage TaxID=2100421 RepID=A0A6J5M1M8_9CAUD|nr:hypothetical protein UFOVP345_44 [uncultured Caudovirales phage]
MPVIINGSTGVSGTDGSAGTPAVQGTDTNTGMFFPAADQIAFAEGGVEAMRLDASGNVGIGTATPGVRLHVAGPGSPEVSIRSTEAASWKARLSFGNASVRWEVGSDINAVGNNNFYFYDAMAGVERARITAAGDFQFNSGYGSVAAAFGCRAWVNFNGQGTVAIRASGNVSSITDNGAGEYTVNFANAMPDVNYAVAHGRSDAFTGRTVTSHIQDGQTTTSVRIVSRVSFSSSYDTTEDALNVYVAIFR